MVLRVLSLLVHNFYVELHGATRTHLLTVVDCSWSYKKCHSGQRCHLLGRLSFPCFDAADAVQRGCRAVNHNRRQRTISCSTMTREARRTIGVASVYLRALLYGSKMLVSDILSSHPKPCLAPIGNIARLSGILRDALCFRRSLQRNERGPRSDDISNRAVVHYTG
jgi:hypothetical protein